MTMHQLAGRTDSELNWYQRRDFLVAAASWTALGGFPAAHAQARSNIVQLQGDALVNGARLLPGQSIKTGDRISTGPQSSLIFVVGNSAFHVRQNTTLSTEGESTSLAVSILRLVSGAVVSVWGKGDSRRIVTPTVTAGIRGTGVYTEIFAEQNNRTYFCNCYGTVDLAAGNQSKVVQADYHEAYWAEPESKDGRMFTPARAINHTDEELEYLAQLTDQKTAWQLAGKKGSKSSYSY